jgi:hypothetical protein
MVIRCRYGVKEVMSTERINMARFLAEKKPVLWRWGQRMTIWEEWILSSNEILKLKK